MTTPIPFLAPDFNSLYPIVKRAEQRLIDAQVAFGHGTTNAFDEAAWLTLHALGLPIDTDLSLPLAADVQLDAWAQVEPLIDRRVASRQPAAYLTREAWLQGVPFYVDERCIVPRSFIAELLADGGFDTWLSGDTRAVLDLCTGNASLAVLAAMAFPEVQVDACDLSADALAVARINVDRHQLGERIRLFESNGLAACFAHGQPIVYDLIVCNPPYVNADSMAALAPEFRAEPAMALGSGTDGMDFIRTLLPGVARHLSTDGVLVLEIGHERANFERAFPTLPPVWLASSAGPDLVLLLTRDMLTV